MIIFRLIQGVGGGFLMANSAAILTDAFPANERGMALGLNMVATLAGSLIGLSSAGSCPPSGGAPSSWSACPSASSARSGPTRCCASRARTRGARAASTCSATSASAAG